VNQYSALSCYTQTIIGTNTVEAMEQTEAISK